MVRWIIALEKNPTTGVEPPALGPWEVPLVGGKCTLKVGRKQDEDGTVDVIISSDKSMSRVQAAFTYDEASQALTILDLKSRFGTYVGDEKLGECPLTLSDGTKLKLGSTHFVVRHIVEKVPVVVCMSGIASAQKAKLKAACEAIGATIAKDWQDDVRRSPTRIEARPGVPFKHAIAHSALASRRR